MTNVIGPFDKEDFRTMLQLKKTIAAMLPKKDKYNLIIKGDQKLLNKYMKREAA